MIETKAVQSPTPKLSAAEDAEALRDNLGIYLNEVGSFQNGAELGLDEQRNIFKQLEKARLAYQLLSLIEPESITAALKGSIGTVPISSTGTATTKQ